MYSSRFTGAILSRATDLLLLLVAISVIVSGAAVIILRSSVHLIVFHEKKRPLPLHNKHIYIESVYKEIYIYIRRINNGIIVKK